MAIVGLTLKYVLI